MPACGYRVVPGGRMIDFLVANLMRGFADFAEVRSFRRLGVLWQQMMTSPESSDENFKLPG